MRNKRPFCFPRLVCSFHCLIIFCRPALNGSYFQELRVLGQREPTLELIQMRSLLLSAEPEPAEALAS